MYKTNRIARTVLLVNKSSEGESIEAKIRRILANKEGISDTAEPIFTERKDGVIPDYNIRADKWEIVADAMDKKAEHLRDKRAGKVVKLEDKKEAKKEADGKPESSQGTTQTGD